MQQFRYLDQNGNFDYERYRAVQTAGNKAKINGQWVDEPTIEWLAGEIRSRVEPIRFGICHGTRRGMEQAWFSKYLSCDVLGTEISDTANQFPNTIQWDFHEVKPEWVGVVDFMYSNSWDHSYDPYKLFPAWMSCIRVGGICILEHTANHQTATELDPLGLTLDEMKGLLSEISDGTWGREETIVQPSLKIAHGSVKQKVRYHILRRTQPQA